MITAATSFGFESIDKWLVSKSVVFAFMRFAKKRSSSGAMAWSFLPTMYHDGFTFHATLDTLVPKAEAMIGANNARKLFHQFFHDWLPRCFSDYAPGLLLESWTN